MEKDINEMIRDCEKKKTDNEAIVFALGTGRIFPIPGKRKIMEKTMNYIKKLDGFLGVNIVDLWHTLLIFDSLNNAKAARNMLQSKGCPVGQVVPIMIPKEYAKTTKG